MMFDMDGEETNWNGLDQDDPNYRLERQEEDRKKAETYRKWFEGLSPFFQYAEKMSKVCPVPKWEFKTPAGMVYLMLERNCRVRMIDYSLPGSNQSFIDVTLSDSLPQRGPYTFVVPVDAFEHELELNDRGILIITESVYDTMAFSLDAFHHYMQRMINSYLEWYPSDDMITENTLDSWLDPRNVLFENRGMRKTK